MTAELRPYQIEAFKAAVAAWRGGARRILVQMATGCHRAGQLVMLANGRTKRVEDVVVGDELMGPDGEARRVLVLRRGVDEMVEIRPVKGSPWVVNIDHILTLVRTRRRRSDRKAGETIDVSVREYMTWSKTRKHLYKLFRVGVKYFGSEPTDYPINPHLMGLILGDGVLSKKSGLAISKPDIEVIQALLHEGAKHGLTRIRTSGYGTSSATHHLVGKQGKRHPIAEKLKELGLAGISSDQRFVPDVYKFGWRGTRLQVLAGLLDSDGHMSCGGYDFISKSKQLADDTAFLARSLGFAAYVGPSEKRCQNDFVGTYWRVSISGDCERIPCAIARKVAPARRQKKDVLRTGFSIVRTNTVESYFGFTISGDGRYLLDDFTVTHNCGKTSFFGEITKRTKGNVLILAERKELVEQIATRTAEWCEEAVGIEMAERRDLTQPNGQRPRIVAGCVPSVAARFTQVQFDWPTLIVIDECHHAVADSYRSIIDYFGDSFVLGVTATPDRSDQKALARVFESCAFEYPILRAINEKWLSPIKQFFVATSIDFSAIPTTAGDFNAGQLDEVMRHEAALTQIAEPIIAEGKGRSAMAFCVTVQHAHDLARVLNARTGNPNFAAALDGSSPPEERRRVIAAARAGEIRVLCNCQLLTEGFDWPGVEMIAMARPTKSRALYTQMLGRGTRLSPGKEYCLVLDYTGNCDRHRLVSAVDIFAGEYSDDVAKAAAVASLQASESTGEATDIRELLQISHDAFIAQHARVKYELAARDPFLAVGIDVDSFSDGLIGEPCSFAQFQFLVRHGMSEGAARKVTKAKASKLIGQLIKRSSAGLCTPKQGKVLRTAGIDPTNISREMATQWITDLAAHQYRPTQRMMDDAAARGILLQTEAKV